MKKPICYVKRWRRCLSFFAEYDKYDKEWILQFVPVYRFDWTWREWQSLGEYRQGTSYRRNPNHQKKETSDQTINKTIWRNSKKDWRHGYTWKRGTKCRGECLKEARRNERAWVRQMIYRERYEDIPLKDGTMFYDPWNWD